MNPPKMTYYSGFGSRLGIGLGILSCLLSPDLSLAAPTLSLKAVAKNGAPFSPTSSLNVSPGDIITVDIYLSKWNNPPFDGGSGLLNAYSFTLLGKAGAQSSGRCAGECENGYIAPKGWDAPLEFEACPCDDPCFPVCDDTFGCVGANFHPEQMAFVDSSRVDFAFHSFPQGDVQCTVRADSPDVQWTCSLATEDGAVAGRCQGGANNAEACTTNVNCPGGTCNSNFLSYVGSLYLNVGDEACGTFQFTLGQRIIVNPPQQSITVIPSRQGLTLYAGNTCPWDHQGACCTDSADLILCEFSCPEQCIGQNQRFGGIGSVCPDSGGTCPAVLDSPIALSPPNCAIDASQPFWFQPTHRQGFQSWVWSFPEVAGSMEDAPNDFTVRQVPAATPPSPPTIMSVITGDGNIVTLNFNAPIQPNKWTCVQHIASGVEQCLGFLPGDVNNDRVVMPRDILTLVDNLYGTVHPPLQLHQCDIDRSRTCFPADIITLLDLFNGTGFPKQYQRTIQACPSAP